MKEMKDMLDRMQAALLQEQDLDGVLREKWGALDERVRALHQKKEHVPFAYAGLQEAVCDLAVRFEQAHPHLALLAGQLADMLGRMGV